MVALYLTSVESVGKTALCTAVGKKLLGLKKKVGFMIPVQIAEAGDTDGYKDATFIKESLKLTESVELLCPVCLSRRELEQGLADNENGFIQKIKQANNKTSPGKDVVLMEGLGHFGVDDLSTRVSHKIVENLDAKAMIVLRYSPMLTLDGITQVSRALKQRLLGVVINFVPESKMELVRQDMADAFQGTGVKVLGIFPEVRSLLGVGVGELAEIFSGEILTCPENAAEIVENIMLGAMTPDSGLDYFSRKTNKAAVIRGERADMQLAALETSIRCLVLTGDAKPLPVVVHQSEHKHVPIIMVKQDTQSVIAGIEEALFKARFRNLRKLERFDMILDRYFDFKSLYSGLGLGV